MQDRNDKVGPQNDNERLQGSETDPQKTELEGLKKGGVDPVVHPGDKENAPVKPAKPSQDQD